MTDQDDFEKWYDSKELASYEASYDIATYSGRELLGKRLAWNAWKACAAKDKNDILDKRSELGKWLREFIVKEERDRLTAIIKRRIEEDRESFAHDGKVDPRLGHVTTMSETQKAICHARIQELSNILKEIEETTYLR